MNIMLNGSCDHTAGIADAELHNHFTELIQGSDIVLYGRTTYKLMEDAWPALVKNPSGEKSSDDFAVALDKTQKIVFSKTLKSLSWDTATLAKRSLEDEVKALKKAPGRDVLIGSPSLINQLTQLQLIDEYQLCLHPVIAEDGLQLFKGIPKNLVLKLIKTKTFGAGQIVLYYEQGKD